MKTQRESVYEACRFVGFEGERKYDPKGEVLNRIYEMVTDDLWDGNGFLSERAKVKYNSRELLRTKYVPGMVRNWLERDVRLNGGAPYEPKNPGSRTGTRDEVLKNLKGLRSEMKDPELLEALEEEIANRIAEIAATKVKKVMVDLDKIPADIRARLGL